MSAVSGLFGLNPNSSKDERKQVGLLMNNR